MLDESTETIWRDILNAGSTAFHLHPGGNSTCRQGFSAFSGIDINNGEKTPRSFTREKYSIEVEAAWYTLRDFMHPLDASEANDKRPIPLNTNATLAKVLSKRRTVRPEYMTKWKFRNHLSQIFTFYYRSRHNGTHGEGYGRSDKQAQNLPFAKHLNITHKRKHWTDMYVLLVGVDIDGHNGEKDAKKVGEWLKKEYFQESYWEPSTHFKGRHGYIKLAYPATAPLQNVVRIIKDLFKLIDKTREQLGFQAPVDQPCGLPSSVTFVDEDPYPPQTRPAKQDWDPPIPEKNEKHACYQDDNESSELNTKNEDETQLLNDREVSSLMNSLNISSSDADGNLPSVSDRSCPSRR